MKYIKQFFNSVFYPKTKDTKYTKTIICFIIFCLFICGIALIVHIIHNKVLSIICLIILFMPCAFSTHVFLWKLIEISDNKEAEKRKKGKYKTKYEPIRVGLNDLALWLEKTEEPETLLCKYNNTYFQVDVSFDIDGRNGPYYNKQFYLDEKKVSYEDLIDILREKTIDDKIYVYETFDHNKPSILLEEIKEVKNKDR